MVLGKQRWACCTGTGSDSLRPWKHGWCPDFFCVFSDFSVKCCSPFHFKSFMQEYLILYNDKAARSPDMCCSEASCFEENLLQPNNWLKTFSTEACGKSAMTSTEAKLEDVPTVPLCSVESPQQLYLNYRAGTNMLPFEAHLVCIEVDLRYL